MSTSLTTRVKDLRDRLKTLDRLGANVTETGLLEDLRSELATPVGKLKRALNERALLIESGIGVETPASLNAARKRAVSLLEKFTVEKKAEALKRGVGWTNLIREIKAASDDVGSVVDIRWKAYRQEVFTGEPPGVVRGRIAFTPTNSAGFKRYDQLYQDFRSSFERLPADLKAIQQVQSLAKSLTETANGFDYNVPVDVKRFLEAVQNGGASLDLLTDTVKTWLAENNAFANYRILSRGTDESR